MDAVAQQNHTSNNLAAQFQRIVKRYPEQAALEWAGGSLSYRELDKRSAALAATLSALGIKPGDHIGLHIPRSPELMLAILASVRIGAVYVPLDTAYPLERLQWMANDAGLALLLTTPEQADLGDLPCPSHNIHELLADPEHHAHSDATVSSEAPAYIMYTSGSTGTPKGVIIPQRGILRLTVDPDFVPLGTHSRFLQLAPNAFDLSTLDIWGSWLNGGSLVLAPPQLPDLATLGNLLADNRINTLWLTTSLFNVIVDEAVDILQPLQYLMTGGEALSLPHARKLMAAHPHISLINGYGPTENTTFTTCYTIPSDIPESLPYSPLGPVIRGSFVRVLNEQLQPAAAGEIGELCLGGDGVALGYLNRPELNTERFIDNPNAPGERLYRSGDMGRFRDDGTLEFHGRRDGQVKIRGYRVEPGEIESRLMDYTGVNQALVMPYALPNGDKSLAAFVVCADKQITTTGLREHLAKQLPAWMVPGRFLLIDALPLNANGKADRAALLTLLDNRTTRTIREAANTMEADVLAVYRRVLHDDNCQPDDRFIDLGAQSIQALQIANQLETLLKRRIPLCWIYDYGSPAALAGQLQSSPPEPVSESAAIAAADMPARSFPQERVWFIQQRYPDCRAYHFQATLRLRGALDVSALEQALNALLARHNLLSAGFPLGKHGPEMVEHTPARQTLHAESVAGTTEADAIVATEFLTAFDIENGPLVRWRLLSLADDDHLLVQTEHHLAHDGWSFNILLTELQTLYRAYHAGETPSLPAAADFAAVIRARRARYEQYQATADHAWWQQQLADCVPTLNLPWDCPPPDKERFTGDTDRLVLDDALMQRVHDWAHSLGVSPFAALLSALLVLLHRKSGQTELCVGSGVADRADAASQTLPGMLVNTVLLRNDLSGNPSIAELARRVHRHTLQVLDHQGFPFDRTLALLREQGTAGCWSSPEVMFSMHNSPSPALDWPELDVAITEALSSGTAKSPLNLVLLPTHPDARTGKQSRAITLIWEYSDQYFKPDTMQAWQSEYLTLLEQLPNVSAQTLDAFADQHAAHRISNPCAATMPFCAATPSSTPSTAREQYVAEQLTALWTEWLGGPIDPHAHFVDLGGHSLLAVQLVLRLRELFGVDIALDTFLDNPTIVGLTRAVLDASTLATNDLWRLMIPGPAVRPLFVVPGSYAREKHWYVFTGLMKGVEVQRPTYALYPPHQPEQPDVETMARDAVTAIKVIQPEGPYDVLGECIGGALAFEIARQLTEQGDTVNRLVLLDSLYPAQPPGNWVKRIKDAWRRGRRPQQLRWAIKRHWLTLRGRLQGASDHAITQQLASAQPVLPPVHSRHYTRALANYGLKPWSGKIDYVVSEQLAVHQAHQRWQRAAETHVHQAHGNHHDFIRADLPHNKALLQSLLG